MAKTPSDRPQPRRFAARQRRRLALGGIAAAATVTLTGCEDTPPTFADAHFTSVSECTKAGFPDKLCDAGYNAAWQDYFNTAPQFKTAEECEQEWGAQQCVSRSYDANTGTGTGSSVGSVFVPLLAGFMVSQAMQQRYYRDGDRDFVYISGGNGFAGSPIYRNRSGATVTLDGNTGSNVKAIPKPVNVNTTTVSRSGFGGKGLSRGGGFGG